MIKSRFAAAATALMAASLVMPAAAQADPKEYRGSDGRYHCKKSNGTTGLIAGGAGGALVGNALGGGTVGTLVGAGGGALLGRHLDKKHDAAQNRKNGYRCE